MVGVVGVERLPRNNPLAVHDLIVGDVVDVRVTGNVMFLLVVLLQHPKHLGCSLELGGRVVLVTDHQDVMLDESLIDRGVRVGINRFTQIDATDFGAGVRGHGCDRVGHGLDPPSHAALAGRFISHWVR